MVCESRDNRLFAVSLLIPLLSFCLTSCNDGRPQKKTKESISQTDSSGMTPAGEKPGQASSMLILPVDPVQGEPFSILVYGGENLRKARVTISGPSAIAASGESRSGNEYPYWRIDGFSPGQPGTYKAILTIGKREVRILDFEISPKKKQAPSGVVWKTLRGWDSNTGELYSAWISALFSGCDEQASWKSLHEVTQDKKRNFLFNSLSLGEDDPEGKNHVIMQPDCADNPFFLRAYFAWKMGLPFGYHVSDRGSLNRCPGTGEWITNETATSKTHPVAAFNSFLRKVMDGVHSGTARAALDNEKADYYPVALEHHSLRPGTVYADPYGHTLVIIRWEPQKGRQTGLLLAADAQPDGTIAVKRFWKGNFLFNTSGVVGEPGFKAFRPVSFIKGTQYLIPNKELTASSGFIPFSLQQRKMASEEFYHTMERLINPEPLDPEDELLNLIEALHEQLLVRVTSVANGEDYMKSHPGAVIGMPSGAAAIFQAGGQWEAYSTPNRDLRLLIAMDEVINFPDKVAGSPGDYNLSGVTSPEQTKKKLQELLERKCPELSITYTRTDGSQQKLTIAEILERREAFEMAYNPNDCIDIRWGAQEKSLQNSFCRRRAPSYQIATMEKVRKWFHSRSHPPT